ncbi:hypothetical protein M011DRAFT_465815 [Sporormia fimetaria CBS 119925]|uniref:Transcription initiation factor TFIID subunit 4 n=1 Tax=Sporormia fimetaria CBS 119925 TaxID=1340428 RepID=A0A6A6VFP5_9PLEO|nr:hypothetical protein M011DRAFT_465815 [Sporormia fimetaria CBS 119925]
MANQYPGQYQQNLSNMQPMQTQNGQQQQHVPPRPYSPPSYQQQPTAMSPTMGGAHPAKRQRVSPHPASPYTSPFTSSPYPPVAPPFGTNNTANPYGSVPQTPATPYQHSFNQPQPYQHNLDARPQQSSMPPPRVPASKAQDGELEKANPRDMDVNNISDVLTGSGIDLRAEEEFLTNSVRPQDASFYSQTSTSTASPHGSFGYNQWGQLSGHGAFQGTGPLSQKPVSEEDQQGELLRKHEIAVRVLSESAQAPLTDPFLLAGNVRQRIAQRAYQNGINVNLEGVFDRIPENPQHVKRSGVAGANGEAVVSLHADSLLTATAPFVELLSLITLAAEERVRTVLEDAFALAQSRQHTSEGIVPPSLADVATATGTIKETTAVQTNLSRTAWDDPNSAVSPKTVMDEKDLNRGRLPTPPTEPPPTPKPTISFENPVVRALKRRIEDDYKYEKERIAKRRKRIEGAAPPPVEAPIALPVPEKLTKKERDRMTKSKHTEESQHQRANETAILALGGGKKKYSWMSGGGGGGASEVASPRPSAQANSGAATPGNQAIDRALVGTRRTFGKSVESGDYARKIQIRDIVHVLDMDGKAKKVLVSILARMSSAEKDDQARKAR